jgi:hypothetical protein
MGIDSENKGPAIVILSEVQEERFKAYDSIYHDVKNTSTILLNVGPLIENPANNFIDKDTVKFWNEIKPYALNFLELINFQKNAKNEIATDNLQNNKELFALIDKQYKQLSLDAIDLQEFTSNNDPFYPAFVLYSQKMHEISNHYKLGNSNDFQKFLKSGISSLYSKIQEIPFWKKYYENDSIPEILIEPVNVLNLTLDIVQDVKNMGINKNHPIKIIDYLNQKDIVLDTDKRFLHLIIENLIYNSCKYSKDNEDPIFIDCNSEGISVIDQGIGFSEEDAGIIHKFESHNRTENAAKHATGTGLGLSFAKKCADALGYKLTAKSEGKDKGATFTLQFK